MGSLDAESGCLYLAILGTSKTSNQSLAMKTVLLTLICCYLISCIFLYIWQRNLLYYPQPVANVDFQQVERMQFQSDELELQGWRVNGHQPQALIYYGGNAEQVENNVAFFQRTLPGYSIYLVPYRGFADNPGKPTEKALYSDALYVFDSLRPHHQSLSLMGRSLGSGVATYVAIQREIERLLLITPYDSVERLAQQNYWLFPVSLLLLDKFNSIARIPHISAPTLILTASDDRVIPLSSSQRLAKAFPPSQLTSFSIKGAAHNNITSFEDYAHQLKLFLQQPTTQTFKLTQ